MTEQKKYVVTKRGYVMTEQDEQKSIFPFIIMPDDMLNPRYPERLPDIPDTLPPKLPWDFVGPAAYYEIVPSNNDTICERCQEMAGRVFFAGDYEEGVTAPPFHPNCGCTAREWREERPEELEECITVNGWINLYTNPTVNGEGRAIKLPDPNPRTWFAFEGQDSINRFVRLELESNGITPVVNIDETETMTDAQGRYWIAVGPNVLDPDFLPDDKPAWASYFNWDVQIDAVVLDSAGNTYYIPCVPGDIKNHTYPNGIQQTGYAFPDGGDPYPDSGDGNAIEFMGAWIREHGLGDYRLTGIIVYGI